jgi:hypothetical protein
MSQEKKSIFWEVTVSAILRKTVYMNMRPILNGFRYLARNIFLPSRVMRHCLKHVNLCEASVGCVFVVDWPRYFRRSYDRTKLPRISAK